MNLCDEQEALIENHRKNCSICKSSYQSYLENMKIPQTPPCNKFIEELKSHIDLCQICNIANKKWNENGIEIIPEMRQVAHDISHNKIPNKKDLGKTIKHLTDKLGIDLN